MWKGKSDWYFGEIERIEKHDGILERVTGYRKRHDRTWKKLKNWYNCRTKPMGFIWSEISCHEDPVNDVEKVTVTPSKAEPDVNARKVVGTGMWDIWVISERFKNRKVLLIWWCTNCCDEVHQHRHDSFRDSKVRMKILLKRFNTWGWM